MCRNVNSAIVALYNKTLKALYSFKSMLKDLRLPITVRFNLFDTYVASIMNYCCEIWGFSKSERFERNHNKFLKQTLGVKLPTSNYALFGETGQLPLCIKRNVRKVKYRFKLMKALDSNCILYSLYCDMLYRCEAEETKWFISDVGDRNH